MCACFCFMCAKHVRLPLFHVLLVLLALSNEVADAGSQGWAFSGAPSLFLLSSQVRPDSSSSQPSHCCSCIHTDRWVDSGGSLLSLIAEALAPPRRARLIAEPLAPPRPHPHTCVPTYPRLYTHMNAGCIDGWMMTYRSLSLVLVQPRLSKRLQNTGKNTRGIAKLVLGNGCLALLALPLRLLQMHRTLLPLLLLYIQRSVFVLFAPVKQVKLVPL